MKTLELDVFVDNNACSSPVSVKPVTEIVGVFILTFASNLSAKLFVVNNALVRTFVVERNEFVCITPEVIIGAFNVFA